MTARELPEHLPSLRQLRDTGSVPRVHGNGFIQLDLAGDLRMHVWGHPDIPRQKVATHIHDHVFDFESRVYVGRMVHVQYSVGLHDETGRYRLYSVVPREGNDTGLVLSHPSPVRIEPLGISVMHAGETYEFTRRLFHESLVQGPTVTIMRKIGKTLSENRDGPRPRVLVPVDREPDNEFDRNGFSRIMLWSIIRKVLNEQG